MRVIASHRAHATARVPFMMMLFLLGLVVSRAIACFVRYEYGS